MGGTSSKHGQRQAATNNWGAPLSRSISLPVDCRPEESKNKVASTPSGVEDSADNRGDLTGTNVVNNDLADEADYFYSWYISDSITARKLREEEEAKMHNNGMESCNLGAPIEAIDERQSPSAPQRTPAFLKPRILDRSVSSPIVLEMDSYFWKADCLKISVWRKYFQGDESRSQKVKAFKESPPSPAMSRFNLFSPSRSWRRRVSSARRSFSPKDCTDGCTGLRLLLYPTIQLPPAHSSTTTCSSPINKPVHTDCLFTSSISQPKSPLKSSKEISFAGWAASSDDSLESNASLFDPVLIATFEKALESVCESDWDSANGSTTSFSCSENSCNSSETSSDADSQYMATPQFEEFNVCLERGHNEPGFEEEGRDDHDRKLPFPIVPSNEERDWKDLEFLENYDLRCPPRGDSKIVLYFTSLRVIRRTFEDCNKLRLIFRGLRMHVDERDVWMHSRFRQELTDLLVKGVTVPRLFIKGRYIGGAQEVEQLHEDGILVRLLKGMPTEDVLKPCDGCGDVRFIPCLTCSGSCKVMVEDSEVTQCPCCNENGLIMCPLCSS